MAKTTRTGRVFLSRSISFPPGLLEDAQKRASNLRLSLSNYIQRAIERDLAARGPMVFEEKVPTEPEPKRKKR